jgi:hypothetical protein
MEKIKSIQELKSAIYQLENEELIKRILVKDQIITLSESLRPINILKDTLKDARTDTELKTTAIDNAIGFVSGAAIRKIVMGKSHNPLRNLVGMVLEKLVERNAEGIRTVADNILEKIVNHRKNTENVV